MFISGLVLRYSTAVNISVLGVEIAGDFRKLVHPIGLIILLISMILSGNFSEQIEEGDVLLVTVFLMFGAGIPIILLVVASFRKRFEHNRVS